MFFYDMVSIQREFGPFGLIEASRIDVPAQGSSLPFFDVVCQKT
jgi:hypothetical protein